MGMARFVNDQNGQVGGRPVQGRIAPCILTQLTGRCETGSECHAALQPHARTPQEQERQPSEPDVKPGLEPGRSSHFASATIERADCIQGVTASLSECDQFVETTTSPTLSKPSLDQIGSSNCTSGTSIRRTRQGSRKMFPGVYMTVVVRNCAFHHHRSHIRVPEQLGFQVGKCS